MGERKRFEPNWRASVFIWLGSVLAAEYPEWLPETGNWAGF